jgi:hypothetical protein
MSFVPAGRQPFRVPVNSISKNLHVPEDFLSPPKYPEGGLKAGSDSGFEFYGGPQSSAACTDKVRGSETPDLYRVKRSIISISNYLQVPEEPLSSSKYILDAPKTGWNKGLGNPLLAKTSFTEIKS